MKMVKDKQILVGADFAGYPLKEAVCAHLRKKGWEITDVGVTDPNTEDTDLMFHRIGLRVGSMMDAGFDQVMNLYNNTVLDVGDILDTYIYRITFQRTPNYGFSTAVGLFKGLTNCILLVSVNAVCKKISGTSIL